MKMHELKTDREVFLPVYTGEKTFEIRFNDRDFQAGDSLHLRETVHSGEEMKSGAPLEYSGFQCFRQITHILKGPKYGLAEGWVIMSLKNNSGLGV